MILRLRPSAVSYNRASNSSFICIANALLDVALWLFVGHNDDSKIGAVHGAPVANGTSLRVSDDGMRLFILFENLLRTKSNAQAASLAPIGKNSYPCVLLPFRPLICTAR